MTDDAISLYDWPSCGRICFVPSRAPATVVIEIHTESISHTLPLERRVPVRPFTVLITFRFGLGVAVDFHSNLVDFLAVRCFHAICRPSLLQWPLLPGFSRESQVSRTDARAVSG